MSLTLGRGEFVSLLGPSGCGKSTVLRLVGGLANTTSGRIERHWDASQQPAPVGCVFQEPTLLPWATVWKNVYLPLRLQGQSRSAARTRVEEAIQLVGLTEFAKAYPRELSGGMKMRVSLARALVTCPRLLMLDEPFAALDEITRFRLNDDLLSLWRQRQMTALFVTHSVYESVYLSTRVVVLSKRPGRVVADIPIDLPHPRDESTRSDPRYLELCEQTSAALHLAMGGRCPMSSEGSHRRLARADTARGLLRLLAPVVLGVAVLAGWEAAVRAWDVSSYLLPAPSGIAQAMWDHREPLLAAWAVTLRTMLLALAGAVVGGVLLAALFNTSKTLELSLFPYAVTLQVTPLLAIAPLLLIWIHDPRRVMLLCAWIVAFFPILSGTAVGLRSTDSGHEDLFRLYGASRWQRLRLLLAPTALPYFLAGLRVSVNLALVGAVVAEFVTAAALEHPGLATIIYEAQYRSDTERAFAALALVSLTGVAFYFATQLLSDWLLGSRRDRRRQGRDLGVEPMLRTLCLLTLLTATPATAIDKVTLALNWKAQPELGGFYQAVADGAYREHGLEVTIRQGGPQINNRPLLAAGRIQFLVGTNLLQAFDAVKQGVPTRVVAAMLQKDPQCLIAHPGQGYDEWSDLTRAPLLMAATGRYSFFLWMEAAHGFQKRNLRPYNHSLAPFLANKKWIQQGFATAEPMRVEEASGEAPLVFLLADNGWDSYSTVIETSQRLIDDQPELVQRFVNASILGWYGYLYGDNAAANTLIKRANPSITDGQIAFSLKQMRAMGLVDSGESLEHGIGAMQAERVRSFFDKMTAAGVFQRGEIDPDKAVTLQFVNQGVGLDRRAQLAPQETN
ncbi:unnamed protein product [Ostreobium quekettii]|uniref:Uncharacterized protein n=1 Tax=Ostreobium quekettii TaxID=121088 RepID=A0A8S1IMM3_9CHLO|nr:unnamed protein product [Ostreobium quekettii]